jgi:hypothetical protein
MIPVPTPADVEAVLASIMDGSNVFGRWLKLDRADCEVDHPDFEAWASVALGRTLWWAEPIDPSNFVEEDSMAAGRTPAEAAAAAWVCHCFGHFSHWPETLTEDEYRGFPRRVADGWQFELFDMPASVGWGEIQAIKLSSNRAHQPKRGD